MFLDDGPDMEERYPGGSVLSGNGTTDPQKVSGEPARWCLFPGVRAVGTIGAGAIFDHSGNPRHFTPLAVYSNKQISYISPAPTLEKHRLAIPVGRQVGSVRLWGRHLSRRARAGPVRAAAQARKQGRRRMYEQFPEANPPEFLPRICGTDDGSPERSSRHLRPQFAATQRPGSLGFDRSRWPRSI